MTSLYELTSEYCEAFKNLSESGFDTETIENTLSPLAKTFEEKAQNVVFWVQNLDSELEMLEQHQANIQSRIKKRKEEIAFYRNYIKNNMIKMNFKSIKCPFFDITIKKSTPKLITEDEMSLPSRYFKTETITRVDNEKLKGDLKSGLVIPGAHLEETQSLIVTIR